MGGKGWNSKEESPDDITTEKVFAELKMDFSTKRLSALEIQASIAAWQANVISRDTMTELFRRGEVLPVGRTNEDEARLIGPDVPSNTTHQTPTQDVRFATTARWPAAVR